MSKLRPKSFPPKEEPGMDNSTKQYNIYVKRHTDDMYYERLGLNNIQPMSVRRTIVDNFDTRNTSLRRLTSNIDDLLYETPFHKTHMMLTIFKLTKKGTTSIYSYVYSYGPTGEHLYFVSSPTFHSQDGEFRARLLPIDHLFTFKKKYTEIYEKCESVVVKHIEAGDWKIETLIYYPSDIMVDENKFEKSLKESRLAIHTLAMAWLQDFRKIYLGTIENHINAAYLFVIYNDSDIPVYNSMVELMGDEKQMDIMIFDASTYLSSKTPRTKFYNYQTMQCGQKILPITINEFKAASQIDKLDIKYPSWREIYINKKCSNLVSNFICPTFAVFGDWYFIQNTNPALYDNSPQYLRYEHSGLANTIKHELKALDKKNYVQNQPINRKFLNLSEDIKGTIRHANSTLILADVTIGLVSEYVGRTVKDIPIILKNKFSYHYMKPAFEDSNKFAKHIFEFIYGFACMNVKLGMLHGDMHLNNATFQRYHMYVTKEIDQPIQYLINNPKVLYILGKNQQYLFDHIGFYSMIIDFSRAVIGRNSSIVDDFGPSYAEAYFHAQEDRMLNILFHHFPSFATTNKSALDKLARSKPQLFFKILTAVDSYSICRNLDIMIGVEFPPGATKVKVDPKIQRFLKRVYSHAEKILLDYFERAMADDIPSDVDIEWPNLLLIKEFFEEYRVTDKTPTNYTIVDIFNFLSDLKYDLYDATKLPIDHQVIDVEYRKKFGLSTKDAEILLNNYTTMKNVKPVEILIHQVVDTTDTQRQSSASSSWMIEGGNDMYSSGAVEDISDDDSGSSIGGDYEDIDSDDDDDNKFNILNGIE